LTRALNGPAATEGFAFQRAIVARHRSNEGSAAGRSSHAEAIGTCSSPLAARRVP
jgi:hypothetical protein